MEEARIPAYYVAKRSMTEEEAERLLHILRMTPITCALVSDVRDIELARKFSGDILQTPDPEGFAASPLRAGDRPMLVIGGEEFLVSVFEDGTREVHGEAQKT